MATLLSLRQAAAPRRQSGGSFQWELFGIFSLEEGKQRSIRELAGQSHNHRIACTREHLRLGR